MWHKAWAQPDEDILGLCGVRFDPEAHIPPVEYG
jgi:hypothetical protein